MGMFLTVGIASLRVLECRPGRVNVGVSRWMVECVSGSLSVLVDWKVFW